MTRNDLFKEIDDELFFDEIVKSGNKNKNTNEIDNMKLFYKLKDEFLKINNIKDYKSVQDKLYKNMSKREMIEFELVRILEKLNNDPNMTSQIIDIERLLKMYDEDIPQKVYRVIINSIIKMELIMNIKIGLFVELCELYEMLSKRKIEEN